ncbi:MAG: hypothetical protein ACRDZO_00250 [Egibacteraceae bacterium]
MTAPDAALPGDGARTGVGGTAVAVDVSRDRRARRTLVLLVAGPVIWSAHFMFVYLVVEAGCTGDGPGLRLLNPPVPGIVTLAATAVAALAALACAWWSYRRWRASPNAPNEPEDDEPGGPLAFTGLLLSLLSFVTILFVGLPALVLPSC